MNRLAILLLIVFVIISGCKNNDNKKNELEFKERELELRERELNLKEKNLKILDKKEENTNETKVNSSNIQSPSININSESSPTKYAYMMFSVSEPKLIKDEWTSSVPDLFGKRSETTTMYRAEYEKYSYTTEIQELRNYNEEIKFKYIDKMEENVLFRSNLSFKNDVFRLSDNDKKSLEDDGAKIIDKKINVFNTYKEASIHKNKNNSDL